MKKLSVIIVTYNSENDIYDCIESIFRFSDLPPGQLEVIVVDNGSNGVDEMFSVLRDTYGEQIVLMKNPKGNGGYGQGNNVGIRKAAAPVILIMNPDVRLMEPVFSTAVTAFEKESNLAMYGMKQMLSEQVKSRNSFGGTYRMNGYLFTFLTGFCNRIDWYIPSIMHFSGACFFINKRMFEEIGLFDESVFMYGEEDDIHYRMRNRFKCRLRYNPSLHYIHLTKERKPNLNYEKKLVEVAVESCRTNGFSVRRMIKNRLRNVNVLLLREKVRKMLGKSNLQRYDLLSELRQFLKQRLKDEKI